MYVLVHVPHIYVAGGAPCVHTLITWWKGPVPLARGQADEGGAAVQVVTWVTGEGHVCA